MTGDQMRAKLPDVIHTAISRVWMGVDGIVHVSLSSSAEIGLEEMKASTLARNQVIGSGRAPVLVDMRGITSMSKPAREYGAAPEHAAHVTALALLESSPLGKIIGNLFINFSRPAVPTRLFSSELDATRWLQGFLP